MEAAVAVVRWSREGEPTEERVVPLSILGAEPGAPSVDVESVAWNGEAFTATATNRSAAYTPIAAELAVGGPGGLRLRLEDGYGRWVAPGERLELAFRPAEVMPAGDYQLILEVSTRDGFPPIVRELNFALEADGVAAAADAGATPARG